MCICGSDSEMDSVTVTDWCRLWFWHQEMVPDIKRVISLQSWTGWSAVWTTSVSLRHKIHCKTWNWINTTEVLRVSNWTWRNRVYTVVHIRFGFKTNVLQIQLWTRIQQEKIVTEVTIIDPSSRTRTRVGEWIWTEVSRTVTGTNDLHRGPGPMRSCWVSVRCRINRKSVRLWLQRQVTGSDGVVVESTTCFLLLTDSFSAAASSRPPLSAAARSSGSWSSFSLW